MKRILTIILAVAALASCHPDDKLQFDPTSLPQTKWEGELKFYEADRLKSSSTVTLRFDSASAGEFFQKRNGSGSKENYGFNYSVTENRISFDCPVISGSWSVSEYTANTMKLTLEPGKNGVMLLSLK